LTQLGVILADTVVAELDTARPKETIVAQTALAQGITAQKQGTEVVALDYYTRAATLDPALPEAETRFSALADRLQGTSLTEKFNWLRAFAQTGGNYMFEISADENIPDQILSFSGKRDISLTFRGRGANRTLNNGFTIDSGVTLVLDNNITLRGVKVTVNSGGTLIMNNGSTITGNKGKYSSDNSEVMVRGTFIMNGGTISNITSSTFGKGISVNGGTFTMRGGIISGNRKYGSSGVFVSNGAFTMNGGTIFDFYTTSGGGVSVKDGTFTMNGGTIFGNGDNSSYDAAIYVSNGTFTMSGGGISGNNSGGVYVEGTFTMSNGTISGNMGDGVSAGTFTMNGGEISGNRGDGVSARTFIMNNGTISSNAGIGVSTSGTFTMSNGTISNNAGRGVYVGSYTDLYRRTTSGTFTMRDGTIFGNNGGVWVHNQGTFTKIGGTIYGYSANDPNSNVVKDKSGTIQNYQGHAVWAGDTSRLLKIKETTAGPKDNLSYDGSKTPPTASGAWDN